MKREPMAHKPESWAAVLWEGLWFVVSVLALIGIVLLVSVDNIR